MGLAIDCVIAEVKSRGFKFEKLPAESELRPYHPRHLLIEGCRCQAIPTKLGHPNKDYPNADYFPLYLPHDTWADYLIYVAYKESPARIWVIPRVDMTKDTGWSPESLTPYLNAWELLEPTSEASSDKEFENYSRQLQAVITCARQRELSVKLIETKKAKDGRQWPPVIKRRLLISGRRCSIFTAARRSTDESALEFQYVALRASEKEWTEFNLYVVENSAEDVDILIVPVGYIPKTTTCSLENPELLRFKNVWEWFSTSSDELALIKPIQWRNPKGEKPPTKHELLLQAVIAEAEKRGLLVESPDVVSKTGVEAWVLIEKRRCQACWTKTFSVGKGTGKYVSLNLPKSDWAEFLIYCVAGVETDQLTFYILPRSVLSKNTAYSPNSPRLRPFEAAWNLLKSNEVRKGATLL